MHGLGSNIFVASTLPYQSSGAGITLVQCDDTVSHGAYGSTDETLIARFHGDIGQRYTVLYLYLQICLDLLLE